MKSKYYFQINPYFLGVPVFKNRPGFPFQLRRKKQEFWVAKKLLRSLSANSKYTST
ncbi:MAG: hypothetical protein LAT51_08220 [Flavobacteriaceae bacterium]|nr:hypothetical protein [Flavobacteriaceae bacterium]